MMRDRYKTEIEFFDNRITKSLFNRKHYKLNNHFDHRQLFARIIQFRHLNHFFGDIYGKRILDLGCGNGWVSLYFGRSRAKTWCCDLSPECIKVAKLFIEANELETWVKPLVMPAEELQFEDGFFDFVFMNAALHHCDIERTIKEIRRVLKKKGKAALIEDYAYHPVMRVYRALATSKHTPNEKALTSSDIIWIKSHFSSSEIRYYQLLNIFEFKNSFGKILNDIDCFFINKFLLAKKFSRLVALNLVK